jgi:hypothetical protein
MVFLSSSVIRVGTCESIINFGPRTGLRSSSLIFLSRIRSLGISTGILLSFAAAMSTLSEFGFDPYFNTTELRRSLKTPIKILSGIRRWDVIYLFNA